MHSTNYFNTLIEVAEDCPAISGEQPPVKGDKLSVANRQFDMLKNAPYKYDSDEVLFTVWAERKDIPKADYEKERAIYFSKGQPCFRASPLTKRYGWGVHANSEGKIAIYGRETQAYEDLCKNSELKKTKAMRSKRK